MRYKDFREECMIQVNSEEQTITIRHLPTDLAYECPKHRNYYYKSTKKQMNNYFRILYLQVLKADKQLNQAKQIMKEDKNILKELK